MVSMAWRRYGRKALFFLTWLVGLAWAVWVFQDTPWNQVFLRLRRASPWAWAGWLGLNVAILGVLALRWWWMARLFHPRISFWRILVYRQAAFAVNYFTPGPQFGGEPLQVYWLHRGEGLPLSQAASALLLEKAFEVGGNFAFLVLAGVLVGESALDGSGKIAWWAFAAVPAGMVAYGWALARGRLPLSALGRRWFSGKWLARLGRVEEALQYGLRVSPGTVLGWAALTALAWLGMVAEYAGLWYLLGARWGWMEALRALFLTRLALLTPLPGGMGALEAAQYASASWSEQPSALAAGVALVIRARDVLLGILGWVLAFPMAQRWASVEPTRDARSREVRLPPAPTAGGRHAHPRPTFPHEGNFAGKHHGFPSPGKGSQGSG